MITIALSKGRILEETLPRLKNAGIELLDDPKTSRKLKFPTTHADVQVLIIRASDVPTYVEYGAADLGVTGKDVLIEHGEERFYELLDLNIARCKMMIAGKPDVDLNPAYRRLKVATKYVKSTQHYFAAQGQQVEVIKLYGSMELAPLVGLADCIVDMVDTGNTLRANGLDALVHIMDISSRLIANKAAFKMKSETIKQIAACFTN